MVYMPKNGMRLFPAHAGVILFLTLKKQYKKPVPRTRGGDPVKGPQGEQGIHCSPHTRG